VCELCPRKKKAGWEDSNGYEGSAPNLRGLENFASRADTLDVSALLRLWLCLVLALATAMTVGAGARGNTSRALWVWDPGPLLSDASARRQFLEFCRVQAIDIAWLHVARSAGGSRLQHEDDWRELLQDAHRSAVKIHALDGDPAYVLRERHYVVLDLVDTIIRFNRESSPDQRFDGIHLDNEPHLLAGWQLPSVRVRLLTEYLELNARVQRVVRAEGGLEYGVDIPFWWQDRDEQSGTAIGDVMFDGVRKAASFHILDLVDNVGIMDYRNVAGGDDGIIAHARALLEYGKGTTAKVFVGVETSPVARVESPKVTFDGRSNAEMDRELALAHAAFTNYRSYAGFAIHHYVPYRERFPSATLLRGTR
jgi:hypothetical protein